jgi:Reverse transcriptase (RNA-dependent DNA polymerase)
LKLYIKNWTSITKEAEVINAVIGYYIPFKSIPVQVSEPKCPDFSLAEIAQIRVCIEKLLMLEAIKVVKPCNNQFVSPIFVVPKSDGTGRLILNLKKLNECVEDSKFKMEDYRAAQNLIQRNFYMAKVDLKDAYHLIPFASSHRKYLRFRFQGQLYKYCCLPFGLSCAPRIFTKVMRPVVSNFKRGHLSVAYLDDLLLLGNSINSCDKNVRSTVDLLGQLGFAINKDKSVLVPNMRIEFLGFIFDSSNMTIELPERKIKKLCQLTKEIKMASVITIHKVSEVIGTLISATQPYHIRYFTPDL